MQEPVFESPAVYVITAGEATPENFGEKKREILDVVGAAVDARVTFVQLREKALSARLVYELAAELAALTRGTATRVLINDRADIARAAGCDGVQLTSASLNASVVREAFGEEFLIGVSTHSLDEVFAARNEGASFALFGPVFATPGKGVGQGLDELKRVCAEVTPFPVIAIGGIDADNCEPVIDAGAWGFAAIRALSDPDAIKGFSRRPLRNN